MLFFGCSVHSTLVRLPGTSTPALCLSTKKSTVSGIHIYTVPICINILFSINYVKYDKHIKLTEDPVPVVVLQDCGSGLIHFGS
jgi:hypothetical protein